MVMYNLNLGDLKIIRCNFSMNNLIHRNNRENIANIKSNYTVNFGVSTIYLFNSQSNSFLQIFSCIFIDNDGSIYFEEVGNFSIKSSYFSNNYGLNGIGALYLINSQSNSMIQIMSSNFTDNNSPYNHGGAIYFEQFGNLIIYSSHFRNNNAFQRGGAIYLIKFQSNSITQITSSYFSDNNSIERGGAIYFQVVGIFFINESKFSNNYVHGVGGAIYLLNSQSNSMIQITSCNFTDNESETHGGAIYIVEVGNFSINSGNFIHNFLTFCSAHGGGALYLLSSQSNSMIQITSCNFTYNNSTSYGGAIHSQDVNFSINSSKFSNNFASFSGGALRLYNYISNLINQITNSNFSDNN